jgi:hypothetical protein
MPSNTSPIFPLTPLTPSVTLAGVTACSTRAPTASASLAAANIFQLLASQTNGCKIDRIRVQACSSSITAATVAQTVLIWLLDGTTAWVIDEILVTAVTPSTTAAAFSTEKTYSNLVIPTGYSLYASTTVTTTSSTTALQVTAFGGAF